jgi:hypothetical protein
MKRVIAYKEEVQKIFKDEDCELDERTIMDLTASIYQSRVAEAKRITDENYFNDYTDFLDVDYSSPNVIDRVLDLSTLIKRISYLKSLEAITDLEILRVNADITSCVNKETEKGNQIDESKLEKASILEQLADLDKKDIAKIKEEF